MTNYGLGGITQSKLFMEWKSTIQEYIYTQNADNWFYEQSSRPLLKCNIILRAKTYG